MDKNQFPFSKKNFVLMLIGLGITVFGMVLMSLDNTEFGFGALGLTVGPMIVLGGFMFQFFAILKKPESKE
jgi:uncharacterized membrane-anchored protein YitT (DUF2179 family)